MGQHAKKSASQTKWWWNCPGAAAYMDAHPELSGGSGVHAQMGTAAHALVERCLKEGSEPIDYVGRLIEIIDPDGQEGTSILKEGAKWPKEASRVVFEVDQDMYEAVTCMTDYVRNRCVELGLIEDKGHGKTPYEIAKEVAKLVEKGVVRLESRVNPLPDRDDTGGTADVTIDAWPEVLEIIDYKNGAGVFVPVEGNMQLRSYDLGALHEAGGEDYENTFYTICQPRHMQAPPDGIMREEMTPADLQAWGEELAAAAERVDLACEFMTMVETEAMANCTLEDLYKEGFVSVGEDGSHCTFCELKTNCPATIAKAQELAMVDFEDEVGDIDVPGENRLAIVLPWVPFLDAWIKEAVASAERILLAGGSVEGRKLVRKRSVRSWITQRTKASEVEGGEPTITIVSEEDLVKELIKKYGLAKGDLYTTAEPTFITGPKAEKLLKPKERKAFSDHMLYKPEGGLTMAAEDDSRTAVLVDPGADFEDDLDE